MGKKIIEQLVDDVDGTVLEPGKGETVTFSIDYRSYEIDLTNAHAQELRDALDTYVNAARKISPNRAPRARRKQGSASHQRSGYPLAEIRTWAQKNGFEVSDRGRVSNDVIDAYTASR
ncbi:MULTISPECIES: Lsr2 family protein [unclassified Brevibacterium]|uniref:histone-like nucleoid-structuring protein Lsr2 n=1 Tax=unclassified Brevibacterium TaxID=2614124 RepID=UPI0008A58292|nr:MULTISPECIES: Lsr2 family protein [unclassified Brevibacterium]OFL64933.1 hypothetical protein HMPREF2757_05545 [Brevibacterium sp. HMSC063G07]OFS25280.1 hypothetical protein HMPREF3162_09040 [Brevibacterium sp. HMSC07C04]